MPARVARSWLNRITPSNALLPTVERMRPLAESLHVELPYPPSVNNLFTGNQRGGRTLTPRYREWRSAATRAVTEQSPGRVAGGYTMIVTATRPDRRARDLDNLVKPLADLLKATGCIDGDHLCQHLVVQWAPEPPCKTATVLVSLVATQIRGLP